MFARLCFIFAFAVIAVSTQSFNPTILQDSRDLPKTDGTFGFLYRTEDGIAHAAKGDPDGQIHGRFSYTDPTGLKVNINYNAGSRVTPGYNYNDPSFARPYNDNRQQYQSEPQYQPQAQAQPQGGYNNDVPEYEPQTRPRYRPQPQPKFTTAQGRPRYSSQYREPLDVSQQRRTRPQQYSGPNDVYNDYN